MELAKQNKVCFQTIHNAIVGKTWKHVNKLYPPASLRRKSVKGVPVNRDRHKNNQVGVRSPY